MKHLFPHICLCSLITLGAIACKKETEQISFLVLRTQGVEINETSVNGVTLRGSLILNNREEILDCGFVYSLTNSPNLENALIIKSSHKNSDSFKAIIDGGLVPDTTYYVKGYVRTNNYIVYGNEVTFYSNGSPHPVIDKIEPEVAFWGDTIMITGKHFDHTGISNKVFFNETPISQLWGKKDTIYAVIPNNLMVKKSQVKVVLYGKSSENKSFELYSPVITSISKTEGQYPDTVFIKGNYFSKEHLTIQLKEKACKLISVTKYQISFQIPFLGQGIKTPLLLVQAGETTVANNEFIYNEQIIYGLPKEGVYYKEKMVIKAKNVNFKPLPLSIFIDGFSVFDLSKYQDSIVFTFNNSWYSFKRLNSISIKENVYGSGEELYTSSFFFREPEFKILQQETVINGQLKIKTKGIHSYDVSISGPVNEIRYFKSSLNENNEQLWDLESTNLPPGNYECYLVDDILGNSEPQTFTIKTPILTGTPKTVYSRQDPKIIIEGDNLPNETGNYNSLYKLKHIESGNIISPALSGNNEFFTSNIVGKGNYEIYLEVRKQKTGNSLNINFSDQFCFITRIKDLEFSTYYWNKAIQWDNQILITDGSRHTLIDCSNNTFSPCYDLALAINSVVYCSDKIYALDLYGTVFRLDKQNKKWEIIGSTPNNELVKSIFSHNNQLICITESGKLYTYNSGFIYTNTIPEYTTPLLAHSNGSELLLFNHDKIIVLNFETMSQSGTYTSELYIKNNKEFIPTAKGIFILLNNYLFYWFNPYTMEFHKFSGNEIISMNPKIFFSDENGNLNLFYNEHLYQYNE